MPPRSCAHEGRCGVLLAFGASALRFKHGFNRLKDVFGIA
jgi:hypothetical protein